MKAVDYRETLVTYLRGDSLDNIATTLGVSKATLHSRIKTMRNAGVQIPKIIRKGGLSTLEVSQLNSLIRKHEKEAVNN